MRLSGHIFCLFALSCLFAGSSLDAAPALMLNGGAPVQDANTRWTPPPPHAHHAFHAKLRLASMKAHLKIMAQDHEIRALLGEIRLIEYKIGIETDTQIKIKLKRGILDINKKINAIRRAIYQERINLTEERMALKAAFDAEYPPPSPQNFKRSKTSPAKGAY